MSTPDTPMLTEAARDFANVAEAKERFLAAIDRATEKLRQAMACAFNPDDWIKLNNYRITQPNGPFGILGQFIMRSVANHA